MKSIFKNKKIVIERKGVQDLIFLIGIFIFFAVLIIGLFPGSDTEMIVGKDFFIYATMSVPAIAAIYFIIISFFINWFEADLNSGSGFKDHTEIVKNWTGSFGVWISGYIVKVTGIGAFFLPLLLFSVGLKMISGIRMFRLWVWFQIIVLGLLWLPIILNMIFPSHPWSSLGGVVGSQLNIWLNQYLGSFGSILLLILVPVILF